MLLGQWLLPSAEICFWDFSGNIKISIMPVAHKQENSGKHPSIIQHLASEKVGRVARGLVWGSRRVDFMIHPGWTLRSDAIVTDWACHYALWWNELLCNIYTTYTYTYFIQRTWINMCIDQYVKRCIHSLLQQQQNPQSDLRLCIFCAMHYYHVQIQRSKKT